MAPTAFKLSGVAAKDLTGVSLASAGDVNGDGFADLIVGTNQAEVSYVCDSWSRSSEQILRVDKWSFRRGYAAKRIGSGLK